MFFPNQPDLFAPPVEPAVAVVEPWKPAPLSGEAWNNIDHRRVYAWRIQTLATLRADPELAASARAYYARHTLEFICHWCDTYNPRNASGERWIPFVLFKRQAEFVAFFEELERDQESGLVEKSRDMGFTWLACAISVHRWLFRGDTAIGWGSRKQELVDKIGDASSIFEKMRLIVRRLPDIFLPGGKAPSMPFMKLINPDNGSAITGETGDNIGRGGRTEAYWKDESAHYERPELIQAALDDNTNVQIDISSVNGLGNVFHRKREAGIDWQPGKLIERGYTRVFVADWSDHPGKSREWYDQRKAKAEREGMQHVFAQEVDRNYSAAVQNTIIPYAWLQSCIDAHLHIAYMPPVIPNIWMAGLDVADEGMDRNAQALRQWIVLRKVEEWGERDPGATARRSVASVRHLRGIKVQYDSIGIGSNVKSEYNRLLETGELPPGQVIYVPWNAGGAVVNPFDRIIPEDDESLMNRDFFGNMKAQAWWSLRGRCYKTHQARTNGAIYPVDDLISFDSHALGAMLMPLLKELAQPTTKPSSSLKQLIEKKPPGTKSPNLADAVVQCYFPAPEDSGPVVGGYGG